jgi:hypothetical protein
MIFAKKSRENTKQLCTPLLHYRVFSLFFTMLSMLCCCCGTSTPPAIRPYQPSNHKEPGTHAGDLLAGRRIFFDIAVFIMSASCCYVVRSLIILFYSYS